MRIFLLLMLAGGLGSGFRYLVSIASREFLGTAWPWGTLVVNLVGAFLIGLASQLVIQERWLSPDHGLIIVTGFLGGLTTFSSFVAEGHGMMARREFFLLFAYMGGSLFLGTLAVFLGIRVATVIHASL